MNLFKMVSDVDMFVPMHNLGNNRRLSIKDNDDGNNTPPLPSIQVPRLKSLDENIDPNTLLPLNVIQRNISDSNKLNAINNNNNNNNMVISKN